jgi:hypothetical protein
MSDSQKVQDLLLTELALAEFVVSEAEKGTHKAHGPTTEYFRGQRDLIAKVLAYTGGKTSHQSRGDVLAWYVAARSDGWECESFTPEGDYWEHAILTKEKWVAEVDIVRGRAILLHNDTELQPTFPYQWPPLSNSSSAFPF